MPTYTVVSPNTGKTYEVVAPEGASAADLKARVRMAEKSYGYSPKQLLDAKWAQEVLMGGSDEITGATSALYNVVSSIFGDTKFRPGEAYESGKSAELARIRLAEQEYPLTSTGLSALGLLAGGAGPAKAAYAAGTRSLPALMKAGAKTGAKMGALSGFLSGEDQGRITSAAVGSGLGGMLGGLTPIAFIGTAKGAKWLKQFFGGDPNAGMRYLQEMLQREGLTKTRTVENMRAMTERGSPAMAADVSPGTARLFATQARIPSALSNKAKAILRERQAGQGERLKTAIAKDIGPVVNINEQQDRLVEKAKELANPYYEKAYAESGGYSDEIQSILNTPSGRDAMSRAYRIAADERRDPTKLGFDIAPKTNEVILTRQPSMQTLDYVKRGFDDVLNSFRDSTSGRLNLDEAGRAVLNLQRSFINELDKVNPDYATARKLWGGEISAKNAMLDGMNAINDTADDIAYRTKDMTPNELEYFKLGHRKAMADTIDKGGDFANKVQALAGTEKKRQVLQTLYGEQADFGKFMDKLSDETSMAATYANATGNSETATRLLEAMDFAGGTSPVVPSSAAATLRSDIGGLTGAALNFMRQRGLSETMDKAQRDLLTVLSQTDPNKVSQLLAAPYRVGAENRAADLARAKIASAPAPYMGILSGMSAGPAVSPVGEEEQPLSTTSVPDYSAPYTVEAYKADWGKYPWEEVDAPYTKDEYIQMMGR